MKQNEIARLLPGIFQRTLQDGSPLTALLAVMEALQAPDEAILQQAEVFFNPYLTPESFVLFLASWVDLDWLILENAEEYTPRTPSLPSGIGRLRELIALSVFLAQWRGTAKGLLRFLETACGISGFTIEERVPGPDGRFKPFHIAIHVPPEAAAYMTMITRIIEAEKPAYVTYELHRKEKDV
jgi:phage tail-like protein